MNRPPPPDYPLPAGHRWAPTFDEDWRLVVNLDRRCRANAGHKHRGCGAPAVAELNRSRTDRPMWWAYCADHMYGRWIEEGAVKQWTTIPA